MIKISGVMEQQNFYKSNISISFKNIVIIGWILKIGSNGNVNIFPDNKISCIGIKLYPKNDNYNNDKFVLRPHL